MSAPVLVRPLRAATFADVPHTAAQHIRLALLGAIAHVIEQAVDGGESAALDAYPFLADYRDAIAGHVGDEPEGAARWRVALTDWERREPAPLPLLWLLDAGLTRLQLELLLAVGLVEEDPRFAQLFEQTGRERRPTFGLLVAWWRDDERGDDAAAVRSALLGLVRAGLLTVADADVPRPDWSLAVPHALWDAMRGDVPALRGLTHHPLDTLQSLDDYIAAPPIHAECRALPQLLRSQPGCVLVVRGPAHNGRTTLVGCIARALGRSLLVAGDGVAEDETRWRLFGAISVLLGALPAVRVELGSGETRTLPPLPLSAGTLVVVTSRHGAWMTADARSVVTVELPLPGEAERLRHWAAVAPDQPVETRLALAAAARLTSGSVRRAAAGARGLAALAARTRIEVGDLRRACGALQAARLETLATRMTGAGDLSDIVVDDPTREELEVLVARCRHRERLAPPGGAPGSTGVRALFAGPSGTGKSLAARLLAATLGRDLYRVDLSATVNKYLGETEKNLDQALAAAEELDVVLLLDEGDALMASRTDVGSANDRYANLETNFLLQRIEAFDGVLVVTSNAAERIDRAFARRMDVVLAFRPPDERRRYEILRRQLVSSAVDDGWLQDVACRCALTGGQLRNVVSHARLLALESDGVIRGRDVYAALVREYRKSGATCPLRPAAPSASARPSIGPV